MSIIQEALAKAQSSIKIGMTTKEDRPITHAEAPAVSVNPDYKKKNAARFSFRAVGSISALILLVIGILVVGTKFLINAASSPAPADGSTQEISYRPITKTDAVTSNILIANVQQSIPPGMLKPVSSPDLVLNGIMYLDDGPRAIINNAIVGAGDTVSGAKVIKINSQSVILENRDVEITLSLK